MSDDSEELEIEMEIKPEPETKKEVEDNIEVKYAVEEVDSDAELMMELED